jgi:hypothetical protein
VVCLQELQANQAVVELNLRTLIPNGKVELDVTTQGRTGSVIVVLPDLEVLDHGHKGDGTFAWVKIQTVTGPLSIGSIYAPADRSKKIQFWRWIHSMTLTDSWVFAGDFNMLEFYDDSLGRSSVLHGAEA